MSEDVQPGVRVDASLWKRFRNDVEARRGAVRGHLRTELETAMRQYLEGGDPTSAGRIDERLARIESAMGVAEADGGVDTLKTEPHTHAPTEKPAPNAATDQKVAYLAECVLDEVVPTSREIDEVPRSVLRDVVKEEYGFRRDTAKRYIRELIDRFELHDHPIADGVLVSTERYQELYEEHNA